MARIGYIEARNAVRERQLDIEDLEKRMEENSIVFGQESEASASLRAMRQNDMEKIMATYKQRLADAETAFAEFTRKQEKMPKTYFDVKICTTVSLSSVVHGAMIRRMLADSVGQAEIIRRALQDYLKDGLT